MRHSILACFVLTFWFPLSLDLSAQTACIRGKILLAESERPIQGASIIVKDPILGDFSDQNGHFSFCGLEKGRSYLMEIHSFGYPLREREVFIENDTNELKILMQLPCDDPQKKALVDCRSGKAKLLLAGGIVPIANRLIDRHFEAKFGILYHDFGCTPPALACMELYNAVVFAWLDRSYGYHWRKRVRKDVIGLKQSGK
ncbi:MAG: carboxypeptidase-like regulatory domain-containing protein [Bacteroidota bacterium]